MIIKLNFLSNKLEGALNKEDIEFMEKVFNEFLLNTNESLSKVSKKAELNIYFMTDEEIKRVNKERRQKDKVTDVLSWKMYEDEMADNFLFGDILISDLYNIKKAQLKNVSTKQELTFLITHGFLHICGYTHDNDHDEKTMNTDTLAIMKEIGIDYSEDII